MKFGPMEEDMTDFRTQAIRFLRWRKKQALVKRGAGNLHWTDLEAVDVVFRMRSRGYKMKGWPGARIAKYDRDFAL